MQIDRLICYIHAEKPAPEMISTSFFVKSMTHKEALDLCVSYIKQKSAQNLFSRVCWSKRAWFWVTLFQRELALFGIQDGGSLGGSEQSNLSESRWTVQFRWNFSIGCNARRVRSWLMIDDSESTFLWVRMLRGKGGFIPWIKRASYISHIFYSHIWQFIIIVI